jgi:hypothetical protein
MQFVSRRSAPRTVFVFVALLFCIAPAAGAAVNLAIGDSIPSAASDVPILQGNVSVTAAPQPTSLFLLSEATILGLALWRRGKNV